MPGIRISAEERNLMLEDTAMSEPDDLADTEEVFSSDTEEGFDSPLERIEDVSYSIGDGPLTREAANIESTHNLSDIEIIEVDYNDYVRRRNQPARILAPGSPGYLEQCQGNLLVYNAAFWFHTFSNPSQAVNTLRLYYDADFLRARAEISSEDSRHRRQHSITFTVLELRQIYLDIIRCGCEIRNGDQRILFAAVPE